MNVYMTEDEQVEAIKKWWNQYGNMVLTVILAIILAYSGWQWWQRRENKIAAQASMIYQDMLSSVAHSDESGLDATANRLLSSYPRTPYAKLAALQLARVAVEKKQYKDAEKQLRWIIANDKTPVLTTVAQLRLARVLLAEKQPEQALNLLQNVPDQSYKPLVAQLRGDVYQSLGQIQKARDAYALALQQMPANAPLRSLLKMKYDNLVQADKLVAQNKAKHKA